MLALSIIPADCFLYSFLVVAPDEIAVCHSAVMLQ